MDQSLDLDSEFRERTELDCRPAWRASRAARGDCRGIARVGDPPHGNQLRRRLALHPPGRTDRGRLVARRRRARRGSSAAPAGYRDGAPACRRRWSGLLATSRALALLRLYCSAGRSDVLAGRRAFRRGSSVAGLPAGDRQPALLLHCRERSLGEHVSPAVDFRRVVRHSVSAGRTAGLVGAGTRVRRHGLLDAAGGPLAFGRTAGNAFDLGGLSCHPARLAALVAAPRVRRDRHRRACRPVCRASRRAGDQAGDRPRAGAGAAFEAACT